MTAAPYCAPEIARPGPRAAPTATICATKAARTAHSLSSAAASNTGGGYSDIDMMWTPDDRYVHKDGTPYDTVRPK